MKTTAFCPISYRKIDEHVARLNGAFTVLFLAVFTVTGNIFPVIFLIIDFLLRSGKLSRFSLLAFLSKNTAKTLFSKPLLINAGPKVFAARIGVVFNFAIIVSCFSGLTNLALIFTGIFCTCAFLESAFGFCVACQFYPFIYRLTYHPGIQKL